MDTVIGRRSRAVPEPQSGPRALLFRTFPGRLFLASTTIRLLIALVGSLMTLPAVADLFAAVATLGILLSLGIFTVRLLRLANRRLLWRVRRKLIISYVFMGVIPAALILVFFLFGGVVMFMNITTYLFKDGYDDFVDEVAFGGVGDSFAGGGIQDGEGGALARGGPAAVDQ